MYAFRFLDDHLQRRLIRAATDAAAQFTIDANGFVVTTNSDDGRVIARLHERIEASILVSLCFISTPNPDEYLRERDKTKLRGVPFLETELRNDLAGQDVLQYQLLMRQELSLPKGSRPWDRR